MRLGGAGHLGNAFADERPGNDELRLAGGGLGLFEGGEECRHVLPIDGLHVPLDRLETLRGVLALRVVRHGIERHVVGIVNEDEIIELEVPGECDGLHGHAFLHAAIARKRDDVVVENLVRRGVVFRRRHLLRNGVTDGIRDALAERPGRGFDAEGFVKFGMARRVAPSARNFFICSSSTLGSR